MKLRWTEGRQRAADWALALAIAAESQVEAWTAPRGATDASPHVIGPRPLLALSYLAASLALVARRRHPVGVLLVVMGAELVPAVAYGTSQGFAQVLPFTVAIYTVGAHCTRRVSVRCMAGLLAVVVLEQALDPTNHDATDPLGAMPFLLLLVLLPWVTGMYLRTRRLYVAELRERAARAEAEREQRAREAVADEQRRIARELHDAVAHAMSVMVVQAEAAEEMLTVDPEKARAPVQRIQSVGRDGLAEMRRLLAVLRTGESPGKAPQPGLAQLDVLADEIRSAGLPVDLTVEGEPRAVPVGVDISAYRIAQEALTNVLRHARATHVDVRLRYGEALELDVEDDGIGVPAAANGGGHGLVGMRERVGLYGGTLEAGPVENGFRVHATLPLKGVR
jgi:signal transduction histidine kinase